MTDLAEFYRGKRVFVTGHTGFKGSWLLALLHAYGATVAGYALVPTTEPSMYRMIGGDKLCASHIGDIADLDRLARAMSDFRPEIVLHLAAQPIVLEGYRDPVGTYRTNVMGTVNLLECVRRTDSVRSVVNVTTDKVYKNLERPTGYREDEELCGFDPYSNSKSCSELVTECYRNAFLSANGVAISTARAGNVIGGGDYAADRIIPDCVRAATAHADITLRNPHSVRPYQHVLEPLTVYLTIAMKQYGDPAYASSYNVGPDDVDCIDTGSLASLFCDAWGDGLRVDVKAKADAPHEAAFLKLDNGKIKSIFHWKPTLDIADAIRYTVAWTKRVMGGGDARTETLLQIEEFAQKKER